MLSPGVHADQAKAYQPRGHCSAAHACLVDLGGRLRAAITQALDTAPKREGTVNALWPHAMYRGVHDVLDRIFSGRPQWFKWRKRSKACSVMAWYSSASHRSVVFSRAHVCGKTGNQHSASGQYEVGTGIGHVCARVTLRDSSPAWLHALRADSEV